MGCLYGKWIFLLLIIEKKGVNSGTGIKSSGVDLRVGCRQNVSSLPVPHDSRHQLSWGPSVEEDQFWSHGRACTGGGCEEPAPRATASSSRGAGTVALREGAARERKDPWRAHSTQHQGTRSCLRKVKSLHT